MNSVKPHTRKRAVLIVLACIVAVIGLLGWLGHAVITYLWTSVA